MLKLCRYDVCYTSYIYSWEKVWNTNEWYRNKKHSGKSAGTDVHAACDSTGCAGSVWEAFPDDALLLLNETVLRLKYSVLVEPQIFKKNSMLHQIAPSCRKRKRVSGTKMVGKWNSLYFFYTITRTRKLFILRQNFILWARNLINMEQIGVSQTSNQMQFRNKKICGKLYNSIEWFWANMVWEGLGTLKDRSKCHILSLVIVL